MSRNNKIHSSGSQHDEIMRSSNNSGKVIITIGPQCAGKTTYLSSRSIGSSSQGRSNSDQSLPPIMDVCLDDQKGIYHTCPIDIFLNPSSNNNNNNDNKTEVFLKQDLYGKSVRERLTQPNMSEMRIVLECIKSLEENPEKELNRNELMKSFSDISSSIRNDFLRSKLEFPNDLLRDMVDALISVSKDLVLKEKQKNSGGKGKMKLMKKEVVDLFVVEAIFREPDKALDKAIEKLKNEIMMSVGDVAWGNTNTRPREYEKALEFAQLSNRSVHFVVFDVSSNNNNNNNNTATQEEQEERDACGIQKIINRKQLLERNICRFCKTGRYIEVKSIDSAISRVSDLTRAALSEASSKRRSKKGNTNNELCFDQALASLAGFEMDNDRKIVRRFGDAKDLQQQQQQRGGNNQRGGGGGRRRPSSPPRGRRPSNNNYREGGGRGGYGHQGRGGPPRSYNNRNNNERWNYDNRRDNRGDGSRRDDNDNYNRNYDNNRRHNQNNNDRNWNNRNNGGGYNNRNDYNRDNDEDQRKRSRKY